jgi:hypothetical protein
LYIYIKLRCRDTGCKTAQDNKRNEEGNQEMSKTVCLDFDGVMNTYDGWKGPEYLFEPRQGLKEFLSKVNEAGFKIAVNSTRTAKSIYGWLDEHNLRIFVDLVTDTKPPAVAYIDDRGICFRGNFDEVFEQLLKFKAFWEK